MKTIEERAYSYYASEQCCRDCENCEDRVNCFDADYVWAFIAGARSEHSELTRWNSPECTPKDNKIILIKTKKWDGEIVYFTDYGFENAERIVKGEAEIIGWREIHE